MNYPVTQNFQYELLFDLSPDLLCIAGFDGYFKKVNPSVSQTLGYSFEELYSRPINEFIHPDDKDATHLTREEIKLKSKPLLHFENRYITKSGEIVWLAWTSQPIPKDQLIFGIAKNVTHKKNLEFERNKLLTDLTRINEEMKNLSYTASHDLRSPVNNLLGIFELINIEKLEDPETVELINILKLASEKLRLTLNNYVDVLNERHHEQIKVEPVNVKNCINEMMESIDFLIANSQAQFHLNIPENATINFSRSYLSSILLNLTTNAIKYSKPNCPPEITIKFSKDEKGVQLDFSDNGIGLDMNQVKDKLFGFQQKFHNHSDSKGIGLYLVYNHITSLGGTISVVSKINIGTQFSMRFKH